MNIAKDHGRRGVDGLDVVILDRFDAVVEVDMSWSVSIATPQRPHLASAI